jgi:hypothetical protein
MMLNFVGAGSPTIIAHNRQSHKPGFLVAARQLCLNL